MRARLENTRLIGNAMFNFYVCILFFKLISKMAAIPF